jgi:ClpP class serine protease
MTRAFKALTADPWAIDPSWLPLMAALAQRNQSAPEVEAAKGWQARDYDLMAGPGAQRLAGADRAYVVDGVAVLPVTGPIFPRSNMMTALSGATSITMLQNDYRIALQSPDVFAIMLVIDSPGGHVSGINSMADTIAAGNKRKPTMAHVAGTAASAAYWLASSAGQITLERTGIVGSIGVVAAVPKQVEPDSEGYVDIEVVSSNAPNKRPDPTSEDGVAEIRATLDAIEAQFIADVARGRNTTATKVKSDFKQGGVAIGSAAVEAGMADRVQSQEATLNSLRRYAANQRKLQALKQQ